MNTEPQLQPISVETRSPTVPRPELIPTPTIDFFGASSKVAHTIINLNLEPKDAAIFLEAIHAVQTTAEVEMQDKEHNQTNTLEDTLREETKRSKSMQRLARIYPDSTEAQVEYVYNDN